jgi:hypothetical protein
MRPNTLAEAVARIQSGAARDGTLAEFIDAFDLTRSVDARYAMLEEEPAVTGQFELDALVGAIAEYLAKQRKLGRVPGWVAGPSRHLAMPWFTATNATPGMREYLTFSSPAEFASRNIFTEDQPLRRARQSRTRDLA